jgi:hypothetical protein
MVHGRGGLGEVIEGNQERIHDFCISFSK